MAAQLIRGFHLLLAGLFAGIGVGVMVACGALFQAVSGDADSAQAGGAFEPLRLYAEIDVLLLIARVFQFIDPLRGAIALALIASSAALMLRSTRRFGFARIGIAVLLTAIQGYHAFSLKPALDSARNELVDRSSSEAPASRPEPSTAAAPSESPPAAFAMQRRAFTLLGLQSLLAAALLVAEPFARMRTARDIAQAWLRSARAGPQAPE